MSVVDQNIKRRTEDEMKEIRQSSIEHIKNIIATESNNQKTNLENLSSLVNSSLKNMR
jgi:hypothetical protein